MKFFFGPEDVLRVSCRSPCGERGLKLPSR